MKKILLLVMVLSGCATGNGVFTGVISDVKWSGWIFDSCEISLILNKEGSSTVSGSTLEPKLCDEYKANVGMLVRLEYEQKTWISSIRTGSFFIIKNIQIQK